MPAMTADWSKDRSFAHAQNKSGAPSGVSYADPEAWRQPISPQTRIGTALQSIPAFPALHAGASSQWQPYVQAEKAPDPPLMPAPHQRQPTRLARTNMSTHEAVIQVSSQQAWQMISTLDEEDLRRLLYRATQLPGGTELSRSISALCTKNKLVEKATVTSFHEYINEASQIWSTYSSISGSIEYENAGRAASDFGTLVEQIENEVTSTPHIRPSAMP
ncbi:hypothetical protein LTR17_018515 [Elasticomyces elasticus]|nr:hypothetical protein LTR17_018515 [Elasticomyces elasticus]